MHCYLDLKYRGWIVSPREDEEKSQKSGSIIPLPPSISHVSSSSHSITLVSVKPHDVYSVCHNVLYPLQTWIPPLGHNVCYPRGATSGHAECSEQGSVTQYAARAYSSGPFKLSGYWAPHQATGKKSRKQ